MFFLEENDDNAGPHAVLIRSLLEFFMFARKEYFWKKQVNSLQMWKPDPI